MSAWDKKGDDNRVYYDILNIDDIPLARHAMKEYYSYMVELDNKGKARKRRTKEESVNESAAPLGK